MIVPADLKGTIAELLHLTAPRWMDSHTRGYPVKVVLDGLTPSGHRIILSGTTSTANPDVAPHVAEELTQGILISMWKDVERMTASTVTPFTNSTTPTEIAQEVETSFPEWGTFMERDRPAAKDVQAFRMTRENFNDDGTWPEWLEAAWQLDKHDLHAVHGGEGEGLFITVRATAPRGAPSLRRVYWGDYIVRADGGLWSHEADAFANTYALVEDVAQPGPCDDCPIGGREFGSDGPVCPNVATCDREAEEFTEAMDADVADSPYEKLRMTLHDAVREARTLCGCRGCTGTEFAVGSMSCGFDRVLQSLMDAES